MNALVVAYLLRSQMNAILGAMPPECHQVASPTRRRRRQPRSGSHLKAVVAELQSATAPLAATPKVLPWPKAV